MASKSWQMQDNAGHRFGIAVPITIHSTIAVSRSIWSTLWPSVIYALCLLAWIALAWPPNNLVHTVRAEMALETRAQAAAGDSTTTHAQALTWQALDQYQLARWRGPYWLRYTLVASPQVAQSAIGQPTSPQVAQSAIGPSLTLTLSLRAASEIYWNGHLLGRNGLVGHSSAIELPGLLEYSVPIHMPIASQNTLLIRASSQHQLFTFQHAGHWFLLSPQSSVTDWKYRPWLLIAMALGALLTAWAYLGNVPIAAQKKAGRRPLRLLVFASLGMMIVEATRDWIGYSYVWHGVRMWSLFALQALVAIALPYYFVQRFSSKSGEAYGRSTASAKPLKISLPVVTAVLITALLPWSFDARGLVLFVGSCLICLLWLWRHRPNQGSDSRTPANLLHYRLLALLSAVLLSALVLGGFFLDGPQLLAASVLSLLLLLAHAHSERELAQRVQILDWQKQQLALQLMQRTMHPHWLMNTLTALQELIETKPSSASVLVEKLAELFAELRHASGQMAITLREEIGLCQRYLAVVSMATQQQLQLHSDQPPAGIKLPAGLILTQIENALTHAGVSACASKPFVLKISLVQQRCTLHLSSANGRRQRTNAHVAEPGIGYGTGRAFIEASLAAHSPMHWRFVQGSTTASTTEGAADTPHWLSEMEFLCAS